MPNQANLVDHKKWHSFLALLSATGYWGRYLMTPSGRIQPFSLYLKTSAMESSKENTDS